MIASHTQAPADQAVREQALDPSRSFIVEAPAGSGKTELLTRRYLRLLACVRAPEEILAITFTRKAAAEMRSRVLKALAVAGNEMAPETPLEKAVWTLAKAVREVDTQHGWQLLSHPARLRIMTIDALNNSLARQLPILSGAGAMLSIARDTQALYAEVVLRLVERLSARDAAADAIARLLRHLDNRYETLESLLSQELARREHWLDVGLLRFDMPTLRAKLEGTLSEIVAKELASLCALIPNDLHDEIVALAVHAAAVLNSMGIESAITACDSLTEFPASSCEALIYWQGIAALLVTDKGTWRLRVDKNLGFPPEDKPSKQRLIALLQRLQQEPDLAEALHGTTKLPQAKYSDRQWQTVSDLLAVLKLAITELEVVMRERGEADYVANAIAARRALGTVTEPTDLALRLDYRLQHLLVDEFQDTSHGQVELLALLTAGWTDGDGRTLFCVGDPMQSIYRFRHADVGLFLNLKQRGLNDVRPTPLRLTVNFRAAKPVLAWVNETFVHALPKRDDPASGAVAFTASEPQADADSLGGVFVHALLIDKNLADRSLARQDEANQIVALIQKSLQQPDIKVAVLVSNRSHLRWVIRELHARGIAFQAVDIDPLVQRPVIQDLIALTRSIVHLADRTAWLSVLRAPWCGLTISDLHALCAGHPTPAMTDSRTVWQLLNDELCVTRLSLDGQARVARIRPVLAMATTLRGRMNLRDCIERTWHALGGPGTVANEAALQDALAYFDRLELIERNGDIEDITRLEDQLSDLYANAGSASARVELMTIHRAKGLEFDVVILPGLDSGARSDDPPLLRVQELPQLGDQSLLLAPIAARGDDRDAIYAWLEQLEKHRAKLEKGRLLYVAATRAERELHLFGVVQSKDGVLSKPRANSFLHLLWPSVEATFMRQTAMTFASAATSAPAQVIRTLRVPLTWAVPIPNGDYGEAGLRDVMENEPLQPEFAWVSETGRHVGTLVHREIERISRVNVEASDIERHATRYAVELAELGVPPHLRPAAAERVVEALTRMLGDERGRWLLWNAGIGDEMHLETASELALSGLIDGDIVNGIIDRTFVAQDGTRWIVDFKTSSHEGGGVEEFLASEVERYRAQLQRYSKLMRAYRPNEPIKAALYFPLLKAWREVQI